MPEMQFIGLTASLDAVLALIAWVVLRMRRTAIEREGGVAPRIAQYFSSYLMFSFGFLALVGTAMLYLTGPVQMIVVMIADISLWISLAYMIILASVGRSVGLRNAALTGFIVMAALGSFYQVTQFVGITLPVGAVATYVLREMAPLMMYAVWVPSAIVFLMAAGRATSPVVKARSVMFALGLLLITFSWAWRLLTDNPSFLSVSVSSIIGFALLLAGVVFRKAAVTPVRAPQFARG